MYVFNIISFLHASNWHWLKESYHWKKEWDSMLFDVCNHKYTVYSGIEYILKICKQYQFNRKSRFILVFMDLARAKYHAKTFTVFCACVMLNRTWKQCLRKGPGNGSSFNAYFNYLMLVCDFQCLYFNICTCMWKS